MEDFNFWWYIIAAVIYFLSRSKKKKKAQGPSKRQPRPSSSRPGTENNPPSDQIPKTFEELLKEITGERQEEPEPIEQEPLVVSETRPDLQEEEKKRAEQRRLEGERRAFADDESRRIYEESIKQAEGAEIKFERDENFERPGLLKRVQLESEEKTYTFADEIRDGLSSAEARKAIIYAEILNRKY